ncbi:hypothetical protein H4Q26_012055 [Puccinia striiformis f. sp. tritici PST-130]|nr:hypothetical protein H4Q26_012055 [Puccinia striiformis f. sp. tritici PST-130]
MINNLKVENIKATIDRSQWLNKLAHGFSRSSPIYLVLVNGNHWVLATVEGEDGVQPIAPVIAAGRSSTKNAKIWATRVMKGLALYNKALAL